MTLALSLVAVHLAAGITPVELEAKAAHTVAQEFERVGRRTPVRDDALSKAARDIAQHALDESAQSAADLVPLTEAVSFADAWDPSPRALIIKGSPADEPLRMLQTRKDLPGESATHVGVGAAVRGKGSAVVLLFAQRRVRLEPFWRRPPRPLGVRELCGVLESPYGAPDVFVTKPDGAVDRAAFSKVAPSGSFCAKVPLTTEGRYTVEVLATGPKGPEVAALFFVDVGDVKKKEAAGVAEPKDPEVARAMIVERINALRKLHGQGPVTLDPAVTKVAQAYSDRMAQGRFFAHIAPEGDTVGKRLAAAGYAFRGAGENLGLAAGPLAAHFGIEHSPGHRRNLLEPAWKKVGIGLSQEETDGQTQVVVTEVFVDPAQTSGDPLADAYRAVAQKRASLKLPAMQRNGVLEALAKAHAQKALALDEPRADLPGEKLHEKVFAALDDVKSASVDFFVADNPGAIEAASKSVSDPRFDQVGIGAVKGDSARFGKDRYWVVVIYAARR